MNGLFHSEVTRIHQKTALYKTTKDGYSPCYHLTSPSSYEKDLIGYNVPLRFNGRTRRGLKKKYLSVRSSKTIFNNCSCTFFQRRQIMPLRLSFT